MMAYLEWGEAVGPCSHSGTQATNTLLSSMCGFLDHPGYLHLVGKCGKVEKGSCMTHIYGVELEKECMTSAHLPLSKTE